MAGDAVTDELVVLLDEFGQPCGAAPKHLVHHAATPLHLAFSCWIFDDAGRTLLTQRAATKITWPGAWTNSFCGHPAPGESIESAVRRRAEQELGASLIELSPLVPDFRYRAVMDDGTVENEICPVYGARLAGLPRPDPAEVGDLHWVDLDRLRSDVSVTPQRYSPWMREQLALLRQGGHSSL